VILFYKGTAMSSIDHAKENLIRELNHVLKDAEDLIKNSEQQAGEGFHSAKEKLEASLSNAKKEIVRIEEVVVNKTKEAARATDAYVHENPWKTAGIAAGVGLLVGLLIAKNK
jgi:ElaB/YqjD/DUF883 family membrane-anchored ribosome-binding protein